MVSDPVTIIPVSQGITKSSFEGTPPTRNTKSHIHQIISHIHKSLGLNQPVSDLNYETYGTDLMVHRLFGETRSIF